MKIKINFNGTIFRDLSFPLLCSSLFVLDRVGKGSRKQRMKIAKKLMACVPFFLEKEKKKLLKINSVKFSHIQLIQHHIIVYGMNVFFL